MVLMLMGWAGSEQPIETTVGIIAKKIGRSARQVHRYFKRLSRKGIYATAARRTVGAIIRALKYTLIFQLLGPETSKSRNFRKYCIPEKKPPIS